MQTELLSIKEACVILNCGVTKFYDLLNQGKIKAVKLEGRTLVPTAEINLFITSLEDYKPQNTRSA